MKKNNLFLGICLVSSVALLAYSRIKIETSEENTFKKSEVVDAVISSANGHSRATTGGKNTSDSRTTSNTKSTDNTISSTNSTSNTKSTASTYNTCLK
jgi:hypothetical protein